MTSMTLRAAAMAALVLLAGCAGGITEPIDDSTATPAGGSPTADATQGPDAPAGDGGTVRFYVSDEPNAIGDFRRLAVTVSGVGFERAGGGENESDGGWVEYAVGNRTVDLTELRGDNATLLDEFDVPSGNYTKVFVHVSDVNATLSTGERVRVKLPSGKLQITKGFAVAPNASVTFVFDIAVHRAGRSGKYVLRPVIAQSGTDVPVEHVDDGEGEERDEDEGDDSEKAEDEESGEREDESGENDGAKGEDRGNVEGESEGDGNDAAEDELDAAFVGDVTPGEDATVRVTRNGSPVENATVAVDGEAAGRTDAGGRLVFAVPADAEELSVVVTAGDDEAELEAEFEEVDGEDGGG